MFAKGKAVHPDFALNPLQLCFFAERTAVTLMEQLKSSHLSTLKNN
jgi:hypothetical protein